jgi:hypothetical protein
MVEHRDSTMHVLALYLSEMKKENKNILQDNLCNRPAHIQLIF